jgi:plasmid stabilization system protein ParE
MPQVIYTGNAINDLDRLREFLISKNPIAAERAAQAIREGIATLGIQPQIGRPIEDMPVDFRDWPIDFGDSGYLARYYFNGGTVIILAIRHQKELDFG